MTFASPLWLLGLLPWIAIVAVLLSGRRRRTSVPFLNLWQAPDALPRPRATIQRPPMWLILMILAMLLAILAAARPWLNFIHRSLGPPITIIVDRGITMSARGSSQPRWKELVESSHDQIAAQLGDGPVDLIFVPDGSIVKTDRADWASLALRQPATNQDTRQALPQIVRAASRNSLVIVLSDQEIDEPRAIRISPATQPRNVGIAAVAMRDSPSPQIMVRVRNDSDLQKAAIKIESSVHEIELPRRGEERNYFFDVDRLAADASVDLLADDDLPADNHATLIKRQSWPAIRAQGELPDDVQRMIRTYAKLRPPEAASMQIVVSSSALSSDQSGVIVAMNADEKIPATELRVVDHPIATDVDWTNVLQDATAAKPQADWRAIVTAGDRMLVAVRASPARQVWIGFHSPTFPRSSDFVIFWTNILDWVGHGGDAYLANGPFAVPIPPLAQTDWKKQLRALPARQRGGFDASTPLLMGAILLVMTAAVVLALAKTARPVNIHAS
ncbi:MAG TPA: hypothetical protein VGF52_02285 [Tepidisphaeraceae bacterium]